MQHSVRDASIMLNTSPSPSSGELSLLDAVATRTPGRASASGRPRRIGIWGHYCGSNQGDDLVVATLIENIRARIPDAEIVGFCLNPIDTKQRHGIEAFPINAHARNVTQPAAPWSEEPERIEPDSFTEIRAFVRRFRLLRSAIRSLRKMARMTIDAVKKLSAVREIPFIWRSYRNLRETDLLIVAGSGPLFDEWGTWMHPYALFKWSQLARLCGTRFVCLSTGAGPIDFRLSRTFVRRAVRTTAYRSYRDASSAKLIASLGVPGDHPVYPDMGFGLDAARYVCPWIPPPAVGERMIVGLNVMAHRDRRYIPRSNDQHYSAYLSKMAKVVVWLLREDYAVLLLPSQIDADARTFADVRNILKSEHGFDDHPRLIEQPIDGLSALASRMAASDIVIAARYHCVILPWLLNKPVLGLAYNRKTFDLMESMGQGAYCLDIDRFEFAELVERFRALECNRDAIRNQLPGHIARCRARLAEQYDRVLGASVAAGGNAAARNEARQR